MCCHRNCFDQGRSQNLRNTEVQIMSVMNYTGFIHHLLYYQHQLQHSNKQPLIKSLWSISLFVNSKTTIELNWIDCKCFIINHIELFILMTSESSVGAAALVLIHINSQLRFVSSAGHCHVPEPDPHPPKVTNPHSEMFHVFVNLLLQTESELCSSWTLTRDSDLGAELILRHWL